MTLGPCARARATRGGLSGVLEADDSRQLLQRVLTLEESGAWHLECLESMSLPPRVGSISVGVALPSAVLYVAAVARVAARPAIALSVAVVAQLPREMQVDVALRMAFSE